MRQLWYSIILVFKDTFRLRGSLMHTIGTIIGTGLALVLLLGLTNGLVQEQKERLRQSPTGCLISGWLASSHSQPFSHAMESTWRTQCPRIVTVIPNTRKVVAVQTKQVTENYPG